MYKPVVVALERDTRIALEAQLERVMAPFMYDPDRRRGTSRCDGWAVGGHWAGHFLSCHDSRTELVNGLPFPSSSPLAGYTACDGGPKGVLDLDRLRREAEEQVWRRWPARFAEHFGTHEPWRLLPPPRKPQETEQLLEGHPDLRAAARGRALAKEGLVTLEGEWIDPDRSVEESRAAHARAGAYVDALDDEVWLICLSVHF